jgi:hypothetical protein
VYINVFLLSQVDSNKQCFHNPVYAYLSAARNTRGEQGVVHGACRASIVRRRGVATEARLTGGASGTLEVPKVESHFLENI